MGRHIDRLNDTERGLIDAAVNAEWEQSGTQGSIDGVIEALNARQHLQGEELAIAMRPFSSAGTYGRFFTGQSTLKTGADFTVFELSDLTAREMLHYVFLTETMFLSIHTMRVDRTTRNDLPPNT